MKKILNANVMVIEELCVRAGYPLLVLEYAGCGHTVRTLEKKIEKVSPHRRKLFLKNEWSGFANEGFASHLLEIKVDTLLLMGVYADKCVFATAESAKSLGYEIITAEPLIAGTDDDYGKSAKWFKKNGIFYKNEISLIKDIKKES